MKNKVIGIITIIYVIVALSTSLLLIKRNEYGIIESNNYYYLVDGETKGTYENDLVKVRKIDSYKVNDYVYFMNYSGELDYGKITSVFTTGECTIGEYIIPANNVYGDKIKTYNLAGLFIRILTEKYVYLFGIILPVFLLFVYEIYILYIYLKKNKKKVGLFKNGKAKKVFKKNKK